jgi:hypothetical protein
MTLLAELNFTPHFQDSRAQIFGNWEVLIDQMQHQAERRLSPYSRQSREGIDSLFNELRGKMHGSFYFLRMRICQPYGGSHVVSR